MDTKPPTDRGLGEKEDKKNRKKINGYTKLK